MEKAFGLAKRGDSGRTRFGIVKEKRAGRFLERNRLQLRDGIDAAAAQQDQPGFARFRVLQNVDGAKQVMFHRLTAAGAAIGADEDTGLRGRVDHPIHIGQLIEVARAADIAVKKLHAKPAKLQAVALAARAQEVVDARHLHAVETC